MIESTDVISQEVKTQLKHIIIDALNRKYISTSSHTNYTTGNRYQSVVLGGENIGGYRKDRSELFSLLNFTGRSVLDCGCNIGELSRLARHRGAVLVDGIEYDGYFVQIAQLINAYHAMTRVSVTQGDLTNEATIQDSYDITLAFSVFPYVLPVLAKLAKATGEALVLETHNITSDLWKIYIEPLTISHITLSSTILISVTATAKEPCSYFRKSAGR
jgi:SAM-dependent methyltransferase